MTWSYWTSADELELQRLPLRAALGRPAARSARCIACESGPALQGLDLACQCRTFLVGDARSEADVIELAFVVEQAKQQRADLLAVRGVAEAADDAVGGAQAFHLHHRALAGRYGSSRRLATTPSSSPPPARFSQRSASTRFSVAGDRRSEMDRRGREEGFECRAALAQRSRGEVGAARCLQQVEHDQDRRRLRGELVHAARRGMQAKLQGIEGEDLADRDRELAVEDEAFGLQCTERRDHRASRRTP